MGNLPSYPYNAKKGSIPVKLLKIRCVMLISALSALPLTAVAATVPAPIALQLINENSLAGDTACTKRITASAIVSNKAILSTANTMEKKVNLDSYKLSKTMAADGIGAAMVNSIRLFAQAALDSEVQGDNKVNLTPHQAYILCDIYNRGNMDDPIKY